MIYLYFLSNFQPPFTFQNTGNYWPLNLSLHCVYMSLIYPLMLHISLHVRNLSDIFPFQQSFYNIIPINSPSLFILPSPFFKETWFLVNFILCWPSVSLYLFKMLFILSFCHNCIILLTFVCIYTDIPELTVGLHPNKPIVSWKYHKLKVPLKHLTHQS